MKYFSGVVDFVNRNFIWVIALFFLAVLAETIYFVVKKVRDGDDFETEKYYVCIITNILAIFALYIVVCLCVGFVNCLKAQDWHLWANYKRVINSDTYISISTTVAVICLIITSIIGWRKYESLILGILSGLLATAVLYFGITYVVGFLLYAVVCLLIIILKLIWFVISGFFVSIWVFAVAHWVKLLISIFTPGVLFGIYHAGKNYVEAFKEEVIDEL